MKIRDTVRGVAARAMHGAIQRAMEKEGPAADRAWIAVTYLQEALDSEGLVVVRRDRPDPGQEQVRRDRFPDGGESRAGTRERERAQHG